MSLVNIINSSFESGTPAHTMDKLVAGNPPSTSHVTLHASPSATFSVLFGPVPLKTFPFILRTGNSDGGSEMIQFY